jgi:LmbE family N-acetylglucosaminyl deacetylase
VTGAPRRARVRDDVGRALVVTAHPDDVDLGAAGTIAGRVATGMEAPYCVCTSGEAGGYDHIPRAEMGSGGPGMGAAFRASEARLAEAFQVVSIG